MIERRNFVQGAFVLSNRGSLPVGGTGLSSRVRNLAAVPVTACNRQEHKEEIMAAIVRLAREALRHYSAARMDASSLTPITSTASQMA